MQYGRVLAAAVLCVTTGPVSTIAANPGLMLGLTNPGLDYIKSIAVPMLLKVQVVSRARTRTNTLPHPTMCVPTDWLRRGKRAHNP